jgi:L-ascorbate metabolism protein UlaG (beta-lactamase superfamily)
MNFLLPLILCSSVLAGEFMPTDEQFTDIGRIKPLFQNGKFANPEPIDSARIAQRLNVWGALKKLMVGKSKNTKPPKPLPAQQVNIDKAFPENQNGLYVTWLGHSSLLVQIDGVRILIDPVFANNVSPIPLIGVRRFQKQAPISADALPFIDAVFISHDHYDHLNAETIIALEQKTGYFLMPSEVAKYFKIWGIDSTKIREYTWWEEGAIQGLSGQKLRFACTPARHFSKRSLFENNKTLWASWVFMGHTHKLFYSGDTSYGLHFKQIGNHYGPFDLTLMENGQYSIYWPYSHILPEDGVRAHLDLRGKAMLPVHWGSFDLSIHNWNEPIERVSAAAKTQGVMLLTPQVGQTLNIDENPVTQDWWTPYSVLGGKTSKIN